MVARFIRRENTEDSGGELRQGHFSYIPLVKTRVKTSLSSRGEETDPPLPVKHHLYTVLEGRWQLYLQSSKYIFYYLHVFLKANKNILVTKYDILKKNQETTKSKSNIFHTH
jgi:hypothetical protein